jgi:hypothetical protein|tara:strand:+ start:651 stop:863 length:213 start_codon:yes stop_codon:yes gene_type:complete
VKTFKIENTRRGTTIKVTLNQPPYENENILYKTGYKEKDCIITEVYSDYGTLDDASGLDPMSPIDFEGEE